MIEVNFTFFIQILNFFILMYILNKLLYQPILKLLEERDEKINGGQQKTNELIEQGQNILSSYNEKLHEAKLSALNFKSNAQKEAVSQANKIIEQARGKADEIITQVQGEMAQEIVRVKKELEPELGVMAATIAQQVLGRKVA